jgi:hypothetical protein
MQCAKQQLAGLLTPEFPRIDLQTYMQLVDHSGRRMQPGKRDQIADGSSAHIQQLTCSLTHWHKMTCQLEQWFGCAVGGAARLEDFAKMTGRRWVKGASTAW